MEQEIRTNLTPAEFRRFHGLMHELPHCSVFYQPPSDSLVARYQDAGLKRGDALIAAFCHEQHVEGLVTENRHFLHELVSRPFDIIDCETCCRRFGLT